MQGKLAAVCAVLMLQGPSCTSSDNFALLGGTLKTMQRAACDDEMVSLACPRGTTISIQVAQYGKADEDTHNCIAVKVPATPIEAEAEEQCLWPNAMQYSLLQTVVEACQKKPHCKFSTKPKPGLVDPCPFARKFVEVAYRCRPSEFRSRTGCDNDVIKLSCNPYSRVAIFDAQYGRTEYESITCPQAQGVKDETCKAPHAAETVMQICHGKRRCSIVTNSKTFGHPCQSKTRSYLKVVYACVPLGVLTERYESAAEKDEVIDGERNPSTTDELFDESDGAGDKWGEPNVVVPVADPALQSLPEEEIPTTTEAEKTIIKAVEKERREPPKSTNFYIFIGVGVLIFLILSLIFIAVRCYTIRKSSRTSKTGDMFTTEAPNVFNDAVSDIDNDIDVSRISGNFYDPVHPDMILYRDMPGNKGTLRAMRPLSTIYPCAGVSMYGNVDYVPREPTSFSKEETTSHNPEVLSPKSLTGYPNTQFYYG